MPKIKNILKAAALQGVEDSIKMRVEIDRITEGEHQTEGVLTVFEGSEKIFQCFTLELAWKDNARRISCIPKNVYNVEKRYSTKYKNHFHVLDVPNRSFILIHQANFVRQLLGCIAVGRTLTDIDKDGLRDVTSSVATMNKLNKILPDTFKLTIK